VVLGLMEKVQLPMLDPGFPGHANGDLTESVIKLAPTYAHMDAHTGTGQKGRAPKPTRAITNPSRPQSKRDSRQNLAGLFVVRETDCELSTNGLESTDLPLSYSGVAGNCVPGGRCIDTL